MTPRRQWVRFNVVGVCGFVVQIATLSMMVRAGLPTAASIAIAVLAAVSHNFIWHERFTWPNQPREGRLGRWMAYQASTGAVSVITNVGATPLVMTVTGLPVVAANAVAVVLMSGLNFVVSDRIIFDRRPELRPCVKQVWKWRRLLIPSPRSTQPRQCSPKSAACV